MAKGYTNSYEEARKQRLEDNKRRFQELGVKKIANSLNDVLKRKNKATPGKNQAKVKSKTTPADLDFLRRSSRPRNQVTYSEEIGVKFIKTSYVSTRVATKDEKSDALNRALSFQRGLLSGNPSFVKSISASNVSNFMLNILTEFCNNHLPKKTKVRIELEDEKGSMYEANYYWVTGCLTGGWKAFSMDHKLDNGDALVMELIEPTKFKVHIFKVSNDISEMQGTELKQTRESEYTATRVVTKAERSKTLNRAMSFQIRLPPTSPSFVKSICHSHVCGSFVLYIPSEFRNNHLSKETKVTIVLEDEEGLRYETSYIGATGQLTAGWKTFSMDHKLDNGDALVMELIEPTRFKVHIFRVSNDGGQVDELKHARESNPVQTVDSEHIT